MAISSSSCNQFTTASSFDLPVISPKESLLPIYKRMADLRQYIPLHLGPLSIAHLQRGLLQHFHRVDVPLVGAGDFAHQEDLAERALAKHFEQFELTLVGLVILGDDGGKVEFDLVVGDGDIGEFSVVRLAAESAA